MTEVSELRDVRNPMADHRPVRIRWFIAYAFAVIVAFYIVMGVAPGGFMTIGFPLMLIDAFVQLEVVALWLSAPVVYGLGRFCGDGSKRRSSAPISARVVLSTAGVLATGLFLVGLAGRPMLRAAGRPMFQEAVGWDLLWPGGPLLVGLFLCGFVHHSARSVQRTAIIGAAVLICSSALAVWWFAGVWFASALVPLAVWAIALARQGRQIGDDPG